MSVRSWFVSAGVALALSAGVVCGQDHAALKPLLVDLPDWEGEEAESMSFDTGGVKMVSATRVYSKGDGEITAMLMVGNQAMAQEKVEDMKAETEDGKVTSTEIDGFQVQVVCDKQAKSGAVLVMLNRGERGGSMFLLEFDDIDDKEAMELAKKFDWKKLKAETAKLLG